MSKNRTIISIQADRVSSQFIDNLVFSHIVSTMICWTIYKSRFKLDATIQFAMLNRQPLVCKFL